MHLPAIAFTALVPTVFGAVVGVECVTSCPLVFDGRVPASVTGAQFDAGGVVPYNNKYDLGQNQTWAQVLQFPQTSSHSLFDNSSTKAVEVTINDGSIFQGTQTGFRRSELLPQPADVNGSTLGIKTLHWSMMSDTHRPLNYSHEYQLVWLESADYSMDQFTVGAGVLYPGNASEPASQGKVLFLRGNDVPSSSQQTFWQTPFADGVWHNFAVSLNFQSNQVELFYSKGNSALTKVVNWTANNLSGQGEYHFGVLKKPTGLVNDITKQGYQESNINEGIVYGGILLEDSTNGCVSTALGKKANTRPH